MSENLQIPELLLPAGNFHKLKVALAYGADAVYCGVPRYSLRVRENDFRLQNLKEAVEYTRNAGKKIYFTVNAIPRNSKIAGFARYLDTMAELKPDALIMADPGLIGITRERHPSLPVHISVQTNTMNYAAVQFWKNIGAERVILSRELSIAEITEIKQKIPDMEIEVFVHGSICIAHSGRCFMSNYFRNRDANQGACNNACRDEYQVFISNKAKHPEQMELIETDEGAYLMNSKDLRGIEYLSHLTRAGVDSVKVEGRTKNDYYVAMVARTYRKALDDIAEGKEFDNTLLQEIGKVASRSHFPGFLTYGMPELQNSDVADMQNLNGSISTSDSRSYAGCVSRYDKASQMLYFELKTRIREGDTLEVFKPGEFNSEIITVEKILHKNSEHAVLSGGIGEVGLRSSKEIPENSFLALVVG